VFPSILNINIQSLSPCGGGPFQALTNFSLQSPQITFTSLVDRIIAPQEGHIHFIELLPFGFAVGAGAGPLPPTPGVFQAIGVPRLIKISVKSFKC